MKVDVAWQTICKAVYERNKESVERAYVSPQPYQRGRDLPLTEKDV